MSSFSSNSGNNRPANAQTDVHIAERAAAQRTAYIKDKAGDAVGNNYTVPKSDFAAFLGYKPPTQGELNGTTPMSGHRVIEVAMQKELSGLGQSAAEHGNAYRNMFVASGHFENQPGREKETIRDGLDSVKHGLDGDAAPLAATKANDENSKLSPAMQAYFARLEKTQGQSHNQNVSYLEMQYKFQEMTKQDGVISNLMKTRHDAVSRTIRGGQG